MYMFGFFFNLMVLFFVVFLFLRVLRRAWKRSGSKGSGRRLNGSVRQRLGLKSLESKQNSKPRRDKPSSWRAAAELWRGPSDKAARNCR